MCLLYFSAVIPSQIKCFGYSCYLCAMKEKKERLSGIMIPEWYFDRERELLECLLRLEEAKRAYRTARNKMVGKMSANGIYRIDSGLATVFINEQYIDGKRRRRLNVILR